MDSTFTKLNKTLPVDVRDEDGIFTRGYVHDIGSDECLLVHFDSAGTSLRPVLPENVFAVHEICVSGDREVLLKENELFEVLLRLSPHEPQRWYTAKLFKNGYWLLPPMVSILERPDLEARSLGKVWVKALKPSASIRRLGFPTTLASFNELNFSVGTDLWNVVESSDFVETWHMLTKSVVVSVNRDNSHLVVTLICSALDHEFLFGDQITSSVEREQYGPSEVFQKYLQQVKRVLEKLGPKGCSEVVWNSGTGPPCAQSMDDFIDDGALFIPDLLGGIFRYMDIDERRILARVCRMWRGLLNSPEVKRVLLASSSLNYHTRPFDCVRLWTSAFAKQTSIIVIDLSKDNAQGVLHMIGDMAENGCFSENWKKIVLANGTVDYGELRPLFHHVQHIALRDAAILNCWPELNDFPLAGVCVEAGDLFPKLTTNSPTAWEKRRWIPLTTPNHGRKTVFSYWTTVLDRKRPSCPDHKSVQQTCTLMAVLQLSSEYLKGAPAGISS